VEKGGIHRMSYEFNIDEVFEMAEQIERNGAIFYRQMAEKNTDMPIHRIFLDLAETEDEHEKDLRSMRATLSDNEQQRSVFDPEGEAALYLRALADLRVFDEKTKEDFTLAEGVSEKEKMRKIFQEAINREKESIVFYVGMKELVPENLGRHKIDDIIMEEMKHIIFLSDELSSLEG
jgi:rubrerythrin